LGVALPRAEPLPAGGEIAFFNQDVSVVHECSPPASLEDRSGWCTMLSWYAGTLHGRSEVTIRTRTTAHQPESLPGLHDPLSRLPGEFYTAYTQTIERVP